MDKCIICGQPGRPAFSQRVPIQPKGTVKMVKVRKIDGGIMEVASGDLATSHMVGPGHPPSDFPGDPTQKLYYGSGASAYRLYHPECDGQRLDDYNKWISRIIRPMTEDEIL